MKYKIIIIFLCLSNLTWSQISYDKNTWILKGNATSLFDIFTFPSVQLSVEKVISKQFSICPEAGYQFYDFRHTDTAFFSPKGFRVNVEFRYYLAGYYNSGLSGKLPRVYTGLRPFYRQYQYNATIPYQTKNDNDNWKDDDFGVKNRSFGLYGILGFQQSVSRKIVLDFHAGLGIIYRKIKNTGLQYNKDAGDILGGTDFIQFYENQNLEHSSGLWGSFLVGMRIGYKL